MPAKSQELADALLALYEHYCPEGSGDIEACKEAVLVLEYYSYATFDQAGKLLRKK